MAKWISAAIVMSALIVITLHTQADPPTFGAIQSFGVTADNSSSQTQSADRIYVSAAVPSSSGVVTGGGMRMWHIGTGAAGATSLFKLVIYADSGGAPGALLAASDESSAFGDVESLYTASFTGANQISVVSGTTYWIGIAIQDAGTASHAISRANTAGQGTVRNVTYVGGPPNPFGTPDFTLNGPYDIYIEYDDAPGGGGGGGSTDGAMMWVE